MCDPENPTHLYFEGWYYLVLIGAQDPILQGGACCSWAMMSAIHRMDECGLIMDQSDAQHVYDSLKECLLHWQGMRSACIQVSLRRWSFRPKHHYLEHVAEQVLRTGLNPRKLSCFQDESYLGQIKKNSM